jgi:hypothetical protein
MFAPDIMLSISPVSAKVNPINAINHFWWWRGCLALVCFCSLLAGSGCSTFFPTTESQYQNLQTKEIKEGTNTSNTTTSGKDASFEGKGMQPTGPPPF